jgi:hypothetical protein
MSVPVSHPFKREPMNITTCIPEKLIIDTLISAVGGGINYWCSQATLRSSDRLSARFSERDGGAVFELKKPDWPRIVALMATKTPRHFANMLCGAGDAETGDVLVQLACFGELKYG